MMLSNTAILVFALVVSLCILAIGILCVVSPRRAILVFSRSSTLVTPDSASDRSTVLQFRIGGIVLAIAGMFFVLIVIGSFMN